jgi:nicotinate-nucleotide adenylyltransferase
MRIGVLGGAFDPPHAAHAALARAARRQLNLDRVVWIPTFAPPHKNGPVASFADRAAMVRALLAGEEDPASEVSEIEASLPQPSYTLHTLRALKDTSGAPEDAWHLILGADNWAGFRNWHQPEAVLSEATLAVYPRAGFTPPTDANSPAPAVMLNFPLMADQSTDFRKALAGPGRDAALAALPAPVADYIRARGLYQGSAGSSWGQRPCLSPRRASGRRPRRWIPSPRFSVRTPPRPRPSAPWRPAATSLTPPRGNGATACS